MCCGISGGLSLTFLPSEKHLNSLFYHKMALHDNNIVSNKRTRVYKLCRICNLQGKKGNALAICTLCTKHVHSNNSCSTRLNNNNNNSDNTEENYQVICNICKAKRKSGKIMAPTTSTANHRSIQLTSITRRSGSAPRGTTPSLASKHSSRRTIGSGLSPTKQNSSSSTCTCNIPAHLDLQQQIDKINETINELNITLANNNTTVNFLKQENQRLAGYIYELQNFHCSSSLNSEIFQNRQVNIPSQSSKYNNLVNFNNNTLFNNKNLNLTSNNNNNCNDNLISNQISSQDNNNFSNIILNSNHSNNNNNNIILKSNHSSNNNNNSITNQNNINGNSDLDSIIGCTDTNLDFQKKVPLTHD